jgi:hypothetical protein
MGATKEYFIKLRENQIQNEFMEQHIIFATLEPEAVTQAPYNTIVEG